MKNEELLPCPFCGGKASLSTIRRDWYRITADHADNCYLEGHEPYCPQADEQLQFLVRDWNTRSGFTAIDMTTAAAEGFTDGVASSARLIDECRQYLQCVVDQSMSRNNAESLADELLVQIAAMSKESKD